MILLHVFFARYIDGTVNKAKSWLDESYQPHAVECRSSLDLSTLNLRFCKRDSIDVPNRASFSGLVEQQIQSAGRPHL